MLFDLIFFVMAFSVGALASPVPKPQNKVDLTRRYSGTKWTWYDVQTGSEVYCGGFHSNSDPIVALSGQNMDQSLCGKRIKMTYNGVTEYATIVDMCPGCGPWALDLSEGLFPDFAPLSDGVIYGDWTFA